MTLFDALGFRWDRSAVPTSVPSHSMARVCFRLHKMLPEFVWDASVLEGNLFTFPEVKTLLDGVTIVARKISDQDSLIRVMNRLGRGYSFEALRAKILFAEGAHKHKLVEIGYALPGNFKNFEMCDSFARITPKASPEPKPYIPKSTESEKPEKNYGADISTLIRMIENGGL